MSENIKETITVTLVAKYGPKVQDQWYSLSPKSGLTPANFQAGKTYQVLVYTSKTGKKYINQIVGEDRVDSKALLESKEYQQGVSGVINQVVRTPEPVKASKFSGRDFDAEARGKVACASWAAALSSPALAMYALNKEDYLTLVETVADKMSKKVFERQGNL